MLLGVILGVIILRCFRKLYLQSLGQRGAALQQREQVSTLILVRGLESVYGLLCEKRALAFFRLD